MQWTMPMSVDEAQLVFCQVSINYRWVRASIDFENTTRGGESEMKNESQPRNGNKHENKPT